MQMRTTQRQRGFTLIEVMLSVVVFMLIGGAIYAFQRNIFSYSRMFTANLNAQQQVQKTFRDFEKEVRTMSPSASGAYPIVTASSTEFTFFSDFDKDGVKERVRYFYATATKSIRRGVIEPTGTNYVTANEVISDRISGVLITATTTSLFTYYNANYDGVGTTSALTQPVSIPSVRLIKFLVAIAPIGQNPVASSTVWFTTQVSMRNLKDNL
jgi:prepilin-type N-terminal cleavage/methylation domain-containing protein